MNNYTLEKSIKRLFTYSDVQVLAAGWHWGISRLSRENQLKVLKTKPDVFTITQPLHLGYRFLTQPYSTSVRSGCWRALEHNNKWCNPHVSVCSERLGFYSKFSQMWPQTSQVFHWIRFTTRVWAWGWRVVTQRRYWLLKLWRSHVNCSNRHWIRKTSGTQGLKEWREDVEGEERVTWGVEEAVGCCQWVMRRSGLMWSLLDCFCWSFLVLLSDWWLLELVSRRKRCGLNLVTLHPVPPPAVVFFFRSFCLIPSWSLCPHLLLFDANCLHPSSLTTFSHLSFLLVFSSTICLCYKRKTFVYLQYSSLRYNVCVLHIVMSRIILGNFCGGENFKIYFFKNDLKTVWRYRMGKGQVCSHLNRSLPCEIFRATLIVLAWHMVTDYRSCL